MGPAVFFGCVHLQLDIIHADDLAAVDIDDLLIEQVAFKKKQTFGAVCIWPVRGFGCGMDAGIDRGNGGGRRTRLPDFVLTMRLATRVRSSCGARVTSRTRPDAAPDGS